MTLFPQKITSKGKFLLVNPTPLVHANRCGLQVSDVYRKIRLTMRFLLGNVHDFDPGQQAVPYTQLPLTDRYLLSRFASLLTDAQTSYSQFQFSRVYQVSDTPAV